MEEFICRICGKKCEDWDDLARHIDKLAKLKDGKHKRTRWVKFRLHKKAEQLMNRPEKKEFYNTALTEDQKQSKEDSRRELSGKTEYVPIRCPKCKTGRKQFVEVEHIENPQAWQENNCYMILCDGCR